MLKGVFFIALTFVIGFHTHAQLGGPGGGGSVPFTINGPANSNENNQETYTINVTSGSHTETIYNVSNGTVISESLSSITIEWTGGQGSIGVMAKINGTFWLASKIVTVGPPLIFPPVAINADPIWKKSFKARWNSVSGANRYKLDASTSSTFDTFVTGFQNKNVNNTNRNVTGLVQGSQYFYRVRAEDSQGNFSAYSNVISVITDIDAPTLSS